MGKDKIDDQSWFVYFKQYLERIFPVFLKEKSWNYKDDLCIIGAFSLAEATGDEKWKSYIFASQKYLPQEDGEVFGRTKGEFNADKISFGKTLRILWDLTGDIRYKAAADKVFALLKDYPRTKTGNFWHKDIYPEQVWLDGLYMIMPFYAKMLAENGENLWDDIIDQFLYAHKLLWDEETGLYVHGCDLSRLAAWADPVTGRSAAVWLRAEGWFLMALADVYELAREYTPRAGQLAKLLYGAAEGILTYQDKETGMFFQVVDKADFPGNYPETSGSAMAAYALMKGTRLEILPRTWGEKGAQVLDGIRSTYLRRKDDGCYLYGICASAGLGQGPDPHNRKDRTGRPEYYISEAQIPDNQHGAAACMMAVSEGIKLFGRNIAIRYL